MPDRKTHALRTPPDVAELRRRAEQLERLNEQLNQRLALVTKTLSVLSHKINNPLTVLLGRAQMLKQRVEDLDVAKAAEVIEQSSKRIADYIRELAEVVKEGREESLERLLDTERPEV
jgi:signal transduction histidine kinase